MSGAAAISMHRGYYKLSIIDLVSTLMDDEDGAPDFDEATANGYRQELEKLAPAIDPLVDVFYGDHEEALARYEEFLDLPEASFEGSEFPENGGSEAVLPLPLGFDQAYLCLRFRLLEEYSKRCLEISLVQTGPLALAPLARLAMDVQVLLAQHLQARKENPSC